MTGTDASMLLLNSPLIFLRFAIKYDLSTTDRN